MNLMETLVASASQLGTVKEQGDLTDESPFIMSTTPFPSSKAPFPSSRAMGEAVVRMWIHGDSAAPQVLRIEVDVHTLGCTDADLEDLKQWVFLHNPRFLFGAVKVFSFAEPGTDDEFHRVVIGHALLVEGLSVSTLHDVLQGVISTWGKCRRHLITVATDRLMQQMSLTPRRGAAEPDMFAELNQLVGLGPVKAMVRQLAAQQNISKLRSDAGMRVPTRSPHLIFTGNPGTGKTTVARLVGKLYTSLGLLTKGHVIEADRSAMIAAYVGQTALKTKELCTRALGGVLFIDEAYSLAVDGRDYGNEAIETLLTFMEDHRGEFVVVAAGYPADMHRFLNSNPGLRSRFDVTLDFPDYSDAELFTIFTTLVAEHDYIIEEAALDRLRACIASLPRATGFGNAREMRRLFNVVACNHAALLMNESAPSRDQLRHLPLEAFPLPSLQASAAGVTHESPAQANEWHGYL